MKHLPLELLNSIVVLIRDGQMFYNKVVFIMIEKTFIHTHTHNH